MKPIFLSLILSAAFVFAETEKPFQRFSALPILGYSEETKIQFGGMLLLFFRPSAENIPASSLDFAVYGTQNRQWQVLLSPDLYLLNGRIHADIEFLYWNWVAHFFGTGNSPSWDDYSTYDMIRYSLEMPLETDLGIPPAFRILRYGLILHAEKNTTTFRAGHEELRPERLGGLRLGAGYQVILDTRNHLLFPENGFYAHWKQVFYGGKYQFYRQTFDLRAYTPLFWNIILALGFLWEQSTENAPFDMLAFPDGIKRFRGIERGFFRDYQQEVWQAELRKHLFWRISGTIFYEAARVGPYFSALSRNDYHHSIGIGGRLALNRSQKLNARGDISLIDGKHLGLSVYIREAF